MTPAQIQMVQDSWLQVKPISEQAAGLFYKKLFETDPYLRSLFLGDMKAQGNKLMTMIGTAVGGLTKLDTIIGAVEELGRRHVGYGIRDRDYDTVGECLLWTLEQGLGDAFTPELKEAWGETYVTLANVMKAAAQE